MKIEKVNRPEQVAALPVRLDGDGKLRVLLVTSRETRRWVPPKGWRMPGRKPWEAASIEAEEEAGVRGEVLSEAIGRFTYDKRFDDGRVERLCTEIYPLLVTRLLKDWKEADERERRWFSPRQAAKVVWEPELRDILLGLSKGSLRITGKGLRIREI